MFSVRADRRRRPAAEFKRWAAEMRHLYLLIFLSLLSLGCERPTGPGSADAAASPKDGLPFLAIWRASDGLVMESEAPYLRIAAWDDGRVVFAQDPAVWSHDLREAVLGPQDVTKFKEALLGTGAFDLEGYCYLVPDAPMDCIMLRVGDRQQMLYWDEREHPGYGINIDPQKRHLDFKKAWKAVNALALSYVPRGPPIAPTKFEDVPPGWYLKEAIQSP